jgi:hypothetical protein
MLRLQLVQSNRQPFWVVSIQSTRTGELRWFSNLDALVQHLYTEYGHAQDGVKAAPNTGTQKEEEQSIREGK